MDAWSGQRGIQGRVCATGASGGHPDPKAGGIVVVIRCEGSPRAQGMSEILVVDGGHFPAGGSGDHVPRT